MFLIGAITWIRAVLLFVTQLVAAIIASYVVKALFPGGLNVNTSLAATTTLAEGVIIEMLLTAQLVFTIFMLAAEKHTGNFIAPVGIGLSFFVAELSGMLPSWGQPTSTPVHVLTACTRGVLDRRVVKPGSIVGAGGSHALPALPLDILGGPTGRVMSCGTPAQADQDA